MLNKRFKLNENKTTVKTELMAGLTTFMAMAYILAVNPGILSAAGMPKGGVLVATALAAFIGTALMAFLTNYPFALAAGMGLNAYFAFAVCGDMGYSWQFALLAVFVEGLVFLALSVTSVRESIFNAIPFSLKKAVAVGIGLFITIIALKTAGVLVSNPATFVALVPFSRVPFHTTGITAILALVGTIITALMVVRKLRGAILFGILITWVLGMIAQATNLYIPDPANGFYSVYPDFSINSFAVTFKEFGSICGALFNPESWTHRDDVKVGWALVKSLDFFVVMFAFFFVDLFDTLGTLIGVSMKGGFLNEKGQLPRISGALYSDSIATSVGAILGTSTTTTYVESASGVAAGGRTGLAGLTTAVLFLLSIALSPLFLSIPGFATAPALIIVGFMMMSAVTSIDFEDASEGVPAFLSIAAMPFFYSISEGISFGVISYTLINLCSGNAKKLHWIMYVLTVLFIAKYALM